MKKKLVFFIVSLTIFLASANAQTLPEEYIIKKGDTLWDISENKLEDNFLWPKLWEVNPQIKNPDLIYPGDKIRIPSKEELMRMFLPKEEVIPPPAPLEIEPVVEIPEKAPPRYIVDKNFYISSGWVSAEFPGIGQIIAAPTRRTIFGNDDIVYLQIDEGTASADKFLAIRDVKIVKHPKTGKKLGHLIKVTGILQIIGKDSNVPKARIISAFEEVQIGDGLLPYKEMEPPIIPDVVRIPDEEGYIVESYKSSLTTGTGDIVYLDKGLNDGLETGDIFSVFSSTTVGAARIEKPIGTLQVISLQPTTSAAVILKSQQEITVGAKWGKKK